MDNSKYFYLGGFLSLSFFLFIFYLFAHILFGITKTKTFGLEKKKYLSVSLVELPKVKQAIDKPHQDKKTQPQASPLKHAKKIKNLDIEDLFSDVWTQKIDIKQKKQKANSKRLAQLQNKIKNTKVKKLQPSDTQRVGEQQENSTQTDTTSSAEEVNEYLAKIQALVYKYFHVPPNTQGNSVKTVIRLDPLGKVVDFRVLQYSANDALNEEVDKMKARLINVIFPKNPNNEYSNTVVILISKE
jgi:protein TonB